MLWAESRRAVYSRDLWVMLLLLSQVVASGGDTAFGVFAWGLNNLRSEG